MSAPEADSKHDTSLLIGPYRSGKTRRLIKMALAFKAKHPFLEAVIIVPSARYASVLKRRLRDELLLIPESERPPGLFGLNILPFYEACRSLLRPAGRECRTLPDELRIVLMKEILADLSRQGKLQALAPIIQFQGTLPSVVELIDELQRAGKSPGEVIKQLELAASAESLYLELAFAYREYWKKCAELRVFDLKQTAMAARELLHGHAETPDPTPTTEVDYALPFLSDPNGIPFAPQAEGTGFENNYVCPPFLYDLLLIDGFDRISHLQAQIIGGLARHARTTCVTFDFLPEALVPSHHAEPHTNTAQSIENPSDSPAMPPGATALTQTRADYDWKVSSYKELLGCVPATVEFVTQPERTPARIDCFSTLDRFLEMREIARLCKEAVTARRVEASRILVIARSIDTYHGAVEAAFEEAGLDYFIDGSIKVSALAQWHFVLRMLSLPLTEYARRDVIDVLRSPYFNLEALALKPDALSRLDGKTYKLELVSGRESWTRFFNASPDFVEEGAALNRLMDLLDSVHADGLSVQRRVTITEDILELLMKLPANDRRSGTTNARLEHEFLRALRRVLKVMIMQETLVSECAVETGEEFLKRLIKMTEGASFARPIPSRSGIMICSADLAPSHCFDEIFIAGMVEGDFPRRVVGRGFLATDQVKRWLSYGIDVQNPRAEPAFERALFYSLLERAQSRIVLSLPQFEMDGSEPIPSFYLKELEESHALKIERVAPFTRALCTPTSPREALSAAAWIGGVDQCERLSRYHPEINQYALDLRPGFTAAISRTHAERNQVYNGYLKDFVDTGALSVPLPEAWTASKLNTYGQCPFRFWVGNILKLEPREEAEAGLTSLSRGELYHKVLEIFFARWRLNPAAMPGEQEPETGAERKDSLQPMIREAFDEALKILEKKPLFVPGPWWEQDKKEMLFRVSRFIRRELKRIQTDKDAVAPALFEVSFGTSNPTASPPLVLQCGDDVVHIRGTIDRIDLPGGKIPASSSGVVAKVIDYKSGGKTISFRDATSGRNLQVPIYALAVEQSILPGSSVIGGLYLSISQAKPSGNLNFTAEKHASLPARTTSLVTEFVRRIKHGDFVPAPGSREVCTHCPHKTMCRVKEMKGFAEDDTDAFD
ncbi:MAG: PD-(D/E)XK nuclease family protein [Candidatus Obscuribacterales bacterium]|nr:PD-(D/E)XK nuclease family protein [Candidatus Obscuribacterales bacterium]